MKKITQMMTLCVASFLVLMAVSPAYAEETAETADQVPEWVKTNAGWWAEGLTSDAEFIAAITHLIDIDIIVIDSDSITKSEQAGDGIPEWIKFGVKWWAEGTTSDAEFIAAITYLIQVGIIVIDGTASGWEAELAACAELKRAYERLDCERAIEEAMTRERYLETATPYEVGPVTYYYPGAHLENTAGGQPLLTVQMLAINYGDDNITLSCSGPAICNYDITDGTNAFKYAATDFTSGSITLKPDQAREFEIIFGPNIGYGGTTFVYDASKEYHFRISETFGSASIPLNLD